MQIPVIRGIIDRRMLVNYRVDPSVLAELLPAPFRPRVVGGVGLVGICLIRLKNIRPTFWPAALGVSSENAAHRMAVEWDDQGTVRQGVYIPRRDTSSWLNVLAGGRLFPGIHHHAGFTVNESDDRLEVAFRSDDDAASVFVRARRADRLPASSVFGSLAEASAFFRNGAVGYSTTADPARFDGLELRCCKWEIEPLAVDEVRSSFFDDASLFPKWSIEFDSALLMRGIEHQWHPKAELCCFALGSPRSQTTSLALPAGA